MGSPFFFLGQKIAMIFEIHRTNAASILPCFIWVHLFCFLGQKIEKLQDFLAKLFDPPTETRVMYPPTLKRVTDKPELAEQYRAVMELSANNGYLEAAHSSK